MCVLYDLIPLKNNWLNNIYDDKMTINYNKQINNLKKYNKLLSISEFTKKNCSDVFDNIINIGTGVNNYTHTFSKEQEKNVLQKFNINKKYVWENSNIEFLENGKMNAFGMGKYEFIDKYLVKCYFGGREHLLKFNNDYSQFTSLRKDDFEIINGHLYK